MADERAKKASEPSRSEHGAGFRFGLLLGLTVGAVIATLLAREIGRAHV